MRSRKPQPWYSDVRRRLWFEREARQHYPELGGVRVGKGRGGHIVYRLRLELPHFEARQVELSLWNRAEPALKRVLADGPTESLHRFGERTLCLWHSSADEDQRWRPEEGLLALIQMVRVHLWQEAHWRATGEWPGPEVPHRRGEGDAGQEKG